MANLFPRKGYEYLIEALAEVKGIFPEICCFIVGEGKDSYRKQLVSLVEEKGLCSQVIFTGFQKDVYEYLNAFDVFETNKILSYSPKIIKLPIVDEILSLPTFEYYFNRFLT